MVKEKSSAVSFETSVNVKVAKKRRKFDKEVFLFLAPAVILMLVFGYYPPIATLWRSFYKWDGVNAEWIGLKNYVKILGDNIFYKGWLNQMILFAGGLILTTTATVLLSELVYNCKSKKMLTLYKFAFVIPMLIPGMVTMIVWTKIIMSPEDTGLLNVILKSLGLEKKLWFWGEDTALVSLLINGFPYMGGTGFLIYYAGLQNIPEGALEASKIDGITTMKRIWYIDLPMLLSQIKFGIITSLISNLQGFSMQLMITQGGPNYTTTVPAYYMYNQAFQMGRFGVASAVGMIIFLITLTLTIVNNKFLKSTEEF